jgi:hypothetical protein
LTEAQPRRPDCDPGWIYQIGYDEDHEHETEPNVLDDVDWITEKDQPMNEHIE